METLPLREIHLPAEIGFWPLASGWWIMISLLFLLCTLLVFLIWSHHQNQGAFKEALRAFEALQKQTDLSPAAQDQQLSLLIRRLAITSAGRINIAGLHGDAWVSWLENRLEPTKLSPELKLFLNFKAYEGLSRSLATNPEHYEEIKDLLKNLVKNRKGIFEYIRPIK